jgi:mRNA-degrading endonuclease YafQ of YafQ-DinJ toxin-antitoxin module
MVAMYLIQILLPLYDNEGKPFSQDEFLRVRDELSERFGGITTYMRSPARGLWKETRDTTVQDDIVIYEVMTSELDRTWWQGYREQLTLNFRQALLIVRVSEIQLL